MYNLLVSGDENAWKGKMASLDDSRCVKANEGTPTSIAQRLGNFSREAIEELKNFPCIFAYEDSHEAPPAFGYLKEIKVRSGKLIIEYERMSIQPWLDINTFRQLHGLLDMTRFEPNRTHWAVKDVDLAEELQPYGIIIPNRTLSSFQTTDPLQQNFEVAFSFPGESRTLVEQVLIELKRLMPAGSIFYDNEFKAFLARPNLDVMMEQIYRDRSKLLVVFLSGDYQQKAWCGLEFRVIKEVVFKREHERVMYIKTDDIPVQGILTTDGYIDARTHTPKQLAHFIYLRANALRTPVTRV